MREAVGFLSRLRRDVRGNMLAFMAALLVPLAALSGSAVDVARLYAVKTRLQQACDAGALAGRKMMVASSDPSLDPAASSAAQTFFTNNFQSGWFKTNSVSFTPTKTSENQVSGTATATVPMAIMGMFGMGARTISVSCEARYDVADADIVFVLDTTGSMACLTSDSVSTCNSYAVSNVVKNADGSYSVTEKSGSRISGLRSAVSSFYTTLTSQADASTHFRFGFVPYSATVNVGHLLPNNYLATSWNYQSRWRQSGASDAFVSGSTVTGTPTSMSSAACTALANTGAYDGSDRNVVTTVSYSGGKCTTTSKTYQAMFHYAQATNVDVSAYTQFLAVTNPAKLDGSKSTWAGCIEERIASGTPPANPSTTSPPVDLDVDSAPATANSGWGPLWPEVEYWRSSATSEDTATVRTTLTRSGGETAANYHEVPCPKQSQRLQTMAASDISDYLSATNGFRAYGLTYHDVGMTWGTRLLSPNGIFKNDTAAWPGHNPPNRYIVFLTDGDMETSATAYASHGMEQFDKRVLGSAATTNLTAYHNNRFVAACTIAKDHNITIFVIAYAQTMTTQLQSCASPGQAYYASDSTALNAAFSQIAKQVAMLRISK